MTVTITGNSGIIHMVCDAISLIKGEVQLQTRDGELKIIEPNKGKNIFIYDYGVSRNHWIADGEKFLSKRSKETT